MGREGGAGCRDSDGLRGWGSSSHTTPPHPPLPTGQTNLLERRLFYIPSFKIYGSVAGFYDYGPPGCAIKQNLTQAWRQHFVLEENMLEVGTPAGGSHAGQQSKCRRHAAAQRIAARLLPPFPPLLPLHAL